MKKIVALVLSLVMALSLCTVAFAYDTGDLLYDALTDGAGTTYKYHAATTYKAGANNEVAWLEATVGANAGKLYLVGGEKGTKLYEDADTVASITRGDEIKAGEAIYNYTAEKVAAQDWSCTTDKHAAGYKIVGTDNKTYYLVGENDKNAGDYAGLLLVDGKIIKGYFDTSFVPGMHALVVPKDGPKELDVGVYEAYCVACKKNVKISHENINGAGFLYEDDYAWTSDKTYSVPSGYVKLGVYDQEATWYVIGTAEATKPADGVTSAKTFDAGVAMYVGMSLLSVAGGAVVIGKKKEF